MVARATFDTSKCSVKAGTVKSASDVTAFFPIKRDGTTILNCAAGDAADGYALETGVAGAVVEFVLAGCGGGPIRAKVGTGGATAGAWLKMATDGVTDAGTIGGGTTLVNVVGKAVETGVVGDVIGILPISFAAVKA